MKIIYSYPEESPFKAPMLRLAFQRSYLTDHVGRHYVCVEFVGCNLQVLLRCYICNF